MHEFCFLFSFASLIKDHTCFKSVENPSCIDLILTNMPKSFQNPMVIETGLSDFHKLTKSKEINVFPFSKKPTKAYFENLNPSVICNNKKFWKNVKPLFSEQSVPTHSITVIENNVITYDDKTMS